MKKAELLRYIGIAEQILYALDCPRSLTVVIMMRNGMWDEIANLTLDPKGFCDSQSFFRAHQATKLLSKAEWLPTTFRKRQVAKAKFEEAELLCAQTNRFFKAYRKGELKLLPYYERVLFLARRKIGKVLGDNLYGWVEHCNFGPGADWSTRHGLTSAFNKLSSKGSITFELLPSLNTFLALTSLGYVLNVVDVETRLPRKIEVVRGNRVTFVPKNAKTERPIAVEPRWNIWMQKGMGEFLRKRLRRFGINLSDQSLNQTLAIYGSRTGKYATLDLASASDTVSKGVVQTLLPEPWLNMFACMRSPAYFYERKWHDYHKWSSMGNGYTFELESLLFWALASSVDEDIAVYGDDLIVPSKSYDTIVDVLGLCGFKVNTSKSYANGPFRESCGTDAFDGDDVTPIYWKEKLDDQGTLTLVNQLSALADRLGPSGFRSKGLKKVWKGLVYQLPKRFQARGPTTISTVVHDSENTWKAMRKWGWDGLHINISVPVSVRYRYWDYEAAVVSQNFSPSSDGFTLRDRLTWKKRTVFIPHGYRDLGTWGP